MAFDTKPFDVIGDTLAKCLAAKEKIPSFLMENPIFSPCFDQWLGRVKPLARTLATLASGGTDEPDGDTAAHDLCVEIDRAFRDLDDIIDLVCRISVKDKAVDHPVFCMI